MSAITSASVVQRTEHQVSTEIDGETVLLQFSSGKYFSLNPVGNFVWSLLEEPRKVDSICQELVQEYEVDVEQCQLDVLALLNELRAADLVSIATSPAIEPQG